MVCIFSTIWFKIYCDTDVELSKGKAGEHYAVGGILLAQFGSQCKKKWQFFPDENDLYQDDNAPFMGQKCSLNGSMGMKIT